MKRVNKIFYIVLTASLTHLSCNTEVGSGNGLSNIFKPDVIEIERLNNSLFFDSTFSIPALVNNDSTFYSNEFEILYADNKAIWFDQYGLNENGNNLLAIIRNSVSEGFDPKDYLFSELDSLSQEIEDLNISQLQNMESKLSYGYLKFAKHLLLGKVNAISIDKNWQNNNDTTWSVDSLKTWVKTKKVEEIFNDLRPAHPWYNEFRDLAVTYNKLLANNFSKSSLPDSTVNIGDSTASIKDLRKMLSWVSDTTLNCNSMVWDAEARSALKTFQTRVGINRTGELDSATRAFFDQDFNERLALLGMNMERMRWLVKDFGKEYIWVNIPEMQVKYFERDSMTFNMNAVVGRVSRKTPTLDSRLSDIVFNPPWYVPPTILRNDILPGIARRGGSYLRRKGLVARDRRGRIVNPSRINSRNYKRYSISQNPGRYSALGSVKFNFPNKESIFLHDTNHRWGFNRKVRASSSGCIRVQHPKDFARFILRDSIFSASNIDSIIDKRKTKSIDIERNIAVHIVYLTNAVDSFGRVVKVNDIYKWDKKLAEQL